MCGRYCLALRPAEVRAYLENENMTVNEVPDAGGVRQSYNFAPGYRGLVYRADAGEARDGPEDNEKTCSYRLQSMKWGLVPFWTKRNPDYGSIMKTINCRDDSLLTDRGMWTTMKQKKRCIVVAQGFYEWLHSGRDKIPHFVKRRDGKLVCFAGLWDSVQFEGSEEKLYTYTIITTSSNKQLGFLHDRMPVILDDADEIRAWLDPRQTKWTRELQAMLRPFGGELEIYAVPKEVGKVGNDSPSFIVPVASRENKGNIENFFANAKSKDESKGGSENGFKDGSRNGSKDESTDEVKDKHKDDLKKETDGGALGHGKEFGIKNEHDSEQHTDVKGESDFEEKPRVQHDKNASSDSNKKADSSQVKKEEEADDDDDDDDDACDHTGKTSKAQQQRQQQHDPDPAPTPRGLKRRPGPELIGGDVGKSPAKAAKSSSSLTADNDDDDDDDDDDEDDQGKSSAPKKEEEAAPTATTMSSTRKTRSAVSNERGSGVKSPSADGSQKITDFFK